MHVTSWERGSGLGEVKATAHFSDGKKLKFYFHTGIFTSSLEHIELSGMFDGVWFRPPNELRGNGPLLKRYWWEAYKDLDDKVTMLTGGDLADIWNLMRDTRDLMNKL